MGNENISNNNASKNPKNQSQIAGAIIIMGILIAGAVLIKGNRPPAVPMPIANNGNNLANMQIRPISADEHILGNPNAKIVIVEYSDSQCPFCKIFHETMHQVVQKSNGKVAWAYRHFPIPQLHPTAFKESESMECAWEQGGNNTFWKYADQLLAKTPSNNGLDTAKLTNIAEQISLNMNQFNTCLDSGKYKAKVQSDMDDGNKAGVNGTPSSFILKNGKIVGTINGAEPLEAVMSKIEALLK